jgi:hypothetical protein
LKDSTDRNNKRNSDMYGILRNQADRKSSKRLINYDLLVSGDPSKALELEYPAGYNPAAMEHAYIDFLESKQIEAMFDEYDKAMLVFNEVCELSQELQQHYRQHSEDPPKS